MKITLNLGTPSSARERYALAWAIPVAVLGVAGLVVLSVVAAGDYKAYGRVASSVTAVEREEAQVRGRERALREELDSPRLRGVYRNTRFINGVIERRQFSIVQLVDKVTKLLNDDVCLDSLGLSVEKKDQVLRMALSADNEEALEKFVVNLEDSRDFADVTIVSQGLAQGGADEEGLATVACTARYVGTP